MKKIFTITFFISNIIFAQKEMSFMMGQTTLKELRMSYYDKDSTADAVILKENNHIYINKKRNFRYTLNYYIRIKFFNKNEIDLATVQLPNSKYNYLENLEAITYNLNEDGSLIKSYLTNENIIKSTENNSLTTLILPNVKTGSIIEYKFSITFNNYGIYDKVFQKFIPVKELNYKAIFSESPKFHVLLLGYEEPIQKKQYQDVNCKGGLEKCITLEYKYKDIPAFKKEKYVSNIMNFISRVIIEKGTAIKKGNKIYKNWEYINYIINKKYFDYIKRSSFYKRKIPKNIRSISNKLEKAKEIYYYTQKYFRWNKKEYMLKNLNLANAYKNKTGNLGEINLTLLNFLEASGFDCNIVLLSTKDNGYLTKLHPTVESFNYLLIRLKIKDEIYFLDATDKTNPFGQVKEKCLNGDARVFDFEKNKYSENTSWWEEIRSYKKTYKNINISSKLDSIGHIYGFIKIKNTGYYASKKRTKIVLKNETEYLNDIEEKYPDLDIENLNINNINNTREPLLETYKVEFLNNFKSNKKIRITPFIFENIKENPFKLKEREYPVDFSFSQRNNYLFSLQISKIYKVINFPKELAFSLPNNGGSLIFKTTIKNNIITSYLRMNINKRTYKSEEYKYLKEFFNQIIKAQNSYITLEKINY